MLNQTLLTFLIFVLFCLFVEYELVRLLSKSQIHGIVYNKLDIGAITPKTR